MRLITLVLCILTLLPHTAQAKEWKLVWSDEFNTPGLPDPAKWTHEEGFVRNEEQQYYTKGRKENARIEDGILIIEGRKEQYKNPRYKADSRRWQEKREFANYTAASITTRGKASWRYGRLEMRAQLPEGKGMWPAFWTLGISGGWPRGGEIDIMEFVGKEPGTLHGNAHFAIDGKHASGPGQLKDQSPCTDFHIYAIEWNADKIDFYYDDTKYHTFLIDKAGQGADNPFRKPHYLLLNFAIGGSWGGPIDDAVLPQKYLVDYVRVYE